MAHSPTRDCQYQTEHWQAFKAVRVAYPPDVESYPKELQLVARMLTIRATEVLIYAEEAEPYAPPGVPQFADLNASLGNLIGKNMKGNVFSKYNRQTIWPARQNEMGLVTNMKRKLPGACQNCP